MAPDTESQNQPVYIQNDSDILCPASQASLPYPYCHTDKCNCSMDDNTSDETPETVHMSDSGSLPDLLRIHWHKKYPETVYSALPGPTHPPVKKKPLSSHYIQLRYIPDCHLSNPAYSSIPPDERFPHDDRYSDRIPHPYIRASGSENPYHYSLPPDTPSYPDMSSHSKMYSGILLPAPQKDPSPESS